MRREVDGKSGPTKPRAVLEVVVAADCPASEEARAIAREMRQLFPTLAIDVIVQDGQRPVPHQVVATPSYLLDGLVVSLGNPRWETLVREIMRRSVRDRWATPVRRHRRGARRADTEEEKKRWDE